MIEKDKSNEINEQYIAYLENVIKRLQTLLENEKSKKEYYKAESFKKGSYLAAYKNKYYELLNKLPEAEKLEQLNLGDLENDTKII